MGKGQGEISVLAWNRSTLQRIEVGNSWGLDQKGNQALSRKFSHRKRLEHTWWEKFAGRKTGPMVKGQKIGRVHYYTGEIAADIISTSQKEHIIQSGSHSVI